MASDVKPGRFAYHAATSKAEALHLKRRYDGEASFLAGGQSLIPLMNMRLAQPQALIDINRVSELAFIKESVDGVLIGAMTRQAVAQRDTLLTDACPLIGEALRNVAHRVVRNRGTIGGSVAHADSAAELPAALAALRAKIWVEDADGERVIAAEEFFEFHFTTSLRPTEMVTAISVPRLPASAGYAFLEVSRRHGDFAVAAVAVLAVGRTIRLAFAGVAPRPVVVETQDDDPAQAAVAAADEAGITEDLSAGRDYRRRLVAVLARRASALARERAESVR